MNTLRRTIHPETRILDAKIGLVEYIASDETLDSYREIIRADGWRFTHFAKNAPFVDSHDYGTLEKLVGKVVDFGVVGKKLVETVQWAIDVGENKLAQLGWKMTEAGYLKGVSVGFRPLRSVNKWDNDRTAWLHQLLELKIQEETGVRTIYIEQEQVELSAVILGANPNALARGYKAGVLDDDAIDFLSLEMTKREPATVATIPAHATEANEQARAEFLRKFEQLIKKI